jgi:Fungal specific transcription factor domain
MCVDFGLYQEEPQSKAESNPRRLDMKRRLFWCSYTLDRSLSGMLGRPPSFPDEWITCPVRIRSLKRFLKCPSLNYLPSSHPTSQTS